MATITDLNELSAAAPVTDDELYGLQKRLLIRIHNLLNGAFDAFDFRENGDVGFEVRPSELLNALREHLELVNRMIADPASRGDLCILISQWDNPDL